MQKTAFYGAIGTGLGKEVAVSATLIRSATAAAGSATLGTVTDWINLLSDARKPLLNIREEPAGPSAPDPCLNGPENRGDLRRKILAPGKVQVVAHLIQQPGGTLETRQTLSSDVGTREIRETS